MSWGALWHLIRHYEGLEKFVYTSRPDRRENTTTDLYDVKFTINAQAVIQISHVRLCNKAWHETISVWKSTLRTINDEEQIGCILGRLNAENKGYFNDNSFVNYDEAMRILKIKTRDKMLLTLRKHGVKMNTVNNQKVGFLRTEVEAVATLEQQPQSKRKKN